MNSIKKLLLFLKELLSQEEDRDELVYNTDDEIIYDNIYFD